jgi:DNA ligase D-like protein (predicted ligase)
LWRSKGLPEIEKPREKGKSFHFFQNEASVTHRINSLPAREAAFIEPMECALVPKVPDGPQWVYEVKLDGYRAIAVKSGSKLALLSRRRKSFNSQFAPVADVLADLPEETVVDGEIVVLDDKGRPNFNSLQHSRSAASHIHYFVFDLLVYKNRDLTRLSLIERRSIMQSALRFRSPRIRISDYIETSATNMLAAVREQGLEGIVAKRKDSLYEPGHRTGAWAKYRVNSGQEFVIGGYMPSTHSLDRIIVGYYNGDDLIYVARVRNGLVPASRRRLLERLHPLVTPQCPFVNLPEKWQSHWGEGLTVEDMKKCVWVRPEIVAQIEFLEWTDGDHLRHAKFAGLRDDKDARSVVKEHAGHE